MATLEVRYLELWDLYYDTIVRLHLKRRYIRNLSLCPSPSYMGGKNKHLLMRSVQL